MKKKKSSPSSSAKEPQKLQRGLNSTQVQLISLGGIIGSSYFLGVGSMVGDVGPAIIISFLIGGWIVWKVAVSMADLAVKMPREGSFVSYARELVGRPWASGVGWSYWLNWCAYIPSEMVAGGLIMHHWIPQVPVILWAVFFGMVITVTNLVQVKNFGMIESGLALIKIAAILLFTVLGILIWTGFAGTGAHFLGTTYLTQGKGWSGFFPTGFMATFLTMVMVLVNFQGTEIIALSAAETENPAESIPKASRNVAIRIIGIFVLPLLILVSIAPYTQGTAENSMFASTLGNYGFRWIAGLFSFVVLTAALSCANSGLYGAVRALYGLGTEKLAPRWVTHLNHQGVPSRATWLTIAVCWAFIPLFVFFEGTSFYVWLLSVSGFSGAICWISISWCHLKMRKKLKVKTSNWAIFMGYLPVIVQILCLVLTACNEKLRSCMIFGVPSLLIPLVAVYLMDRKRTGKGALNPKAV